MDVALMTWLVSSQDGEPTPAHTTTSWLVSYRSVSGDVVETRYDTREQARDALADQLIASALQLWAIGRSYGSPPLAPLAKRQQEFFDRGDRFIHHVMRLMDTDSGEYVIVGKQGRQWLLCALPEAAEVSR